MPKTIEYTVALEVMTCINCGVAFAMQADMNRIRLRDHDWFYCPAGHAQRYTGPSDVERLRKQLKAVEQERNLLASRVSLESDQRQAAERSLRATKGQLTKIKNRVANGVCPVCNRSFSALHRHMESKHPEYKED
jgi:hypothetical protein